MTKSKSKVVGVICMGGLAAACYWYYKNRLNKRHDKIEQQTQPINNLNNTVNDELVDELVDELNNKVDVNDNNEEKTKTVPTIKNLQKTFNEEQKQKTHDEKTKLVDMLHKYSMCLDKQNNNSSNQNAIPQNQPSHQENQQGDQQRENSHPVMLMAEILNASQQQE